MHWNLFLNAWIWRKVRYSKKALKVDWNFRSTWFYTNSPFQLFFLLGAIGIKFPKDLFFDLSEMSLEFDKMFNGSRSEIFSDDFWAEIESKPVSLTPWTPRDPKSGVSILSKTVSFFSILKNLQAKSAVFPIS